MSPASRRTSFGMLLKRTKSSEIEKELKKGQIPKETMSRRQRPVALRPPPPTLPEVAQNADLLSTPFEPEQRPSSAMYNQPLYDSSSNTTTHSQPPYEQYGRPSMVSIPGLSVIPPPIPPRGFPSGERKESMTNRGRYSYGSLNVNPTNGPRRMRRKKDPIPFNILVLGTRNAGKTSFLEFLKTTLAPPPKKSSKRAEEDAPRSLPRPSGHFIPHYFETEIDGERISVTLWDSEGFEKNVVELQLDDTVSFVESKFEETFAEEMKVVRSPNVQDTHIHATFLILDPSRLARNMAAAAKRSVLNQSQSPVNGSLKGSNSFRALNVFDDSLDVQVLRALHHKTTVIPVLSKADTVTVKQMGALKRAVWDGLKALKVDPLEGLGLEESEEEEDSDSDSQDGQIKDRDQDRDEDDESEAPFNGGRYVEDFTVQGLAISPPATPCRSGRLSGSSLRRHRAQNELKEELNEEEVPFFPMSIISPDPYEPEVVGRQFAWGFADPFDEKHCDFPRFKEAVFREWRAELREASREQWYEEWRTNRLRTRDMTGNRI